MTIALLPGACADPVGRVGLSLGTKPRRPDPGPRVRVRVFSTYVTP